MFASLAPIALLALAALSSARPVPHGRRSSNAPAHWASEYLENYDVYHTRYVAIGCTGQQGTQFFDMCCHPMLAGELLSSKPAECIPSASASASAATASASVIDDEECDAETIVASATVAAAVVTAAPTTSSVAPVTTTSSAAPAATTTASSGAVQTGGSATYFWQNGNPGACGNYNSDSTPLVAVPYKWWGTSDSQKSSLCGKYVDITRTSDGAKVTAVIADLCPTCTTDNSLDLSWGAFSQLATAAEGMVDITWTLQA